MPVSPQFRDHVLDLVAPLGPIDTRRMFGGFSVRCEGQHFGVLIDDRLYLVSDAALRAELIAQGGAIFSYTKQGRTVDVPRFCAVPEHLLEEPEALLPFARKALRVARSG